MDQNVRKSAGQALVSEFESWDPLNILKSGKYIITFMCGSEAGELPGLVDRQLCSNFSERMHLKKIRQKLNYILIFHCFFLSHICIYIQQTHTPHSYPNTQKEIHFSYKI